ncbi:MAG: DUF364 domain-containing protein [Deltaproteobacteria bacterium]|nr:DUF364 domain-containing protein [Deltaproteobacteria bacterium]
MKILDQLIESLGGRDHPVREVRCCAFWTAVTTRHTGLSTTYRALEGEADTHQSGVRDVGFLTEKNALELVEYARSHNTLEASIGMAAINSLIEVDVARCVDLNAYDVLLEKGRGRNIAVVGHFPFVPKLKKAAKNLWVIEKRLRPGDLPESETKRILPRCDVVCITGTAFINHTIEGLLSLCRESFVVLTGPTSPLTPLLFDYGIDVICGTRVVDSEEVLRFISEAATFRQLHGHGVRLLSLTREPGER